MVRHNVRVVNQRSRAVPSSPLPVYIHRCGVRGQLAILFSQTDCLISGGNVGLPAISSENCAGLTEFGIKQGAYSINTTHDMERVTEPSGVLT